MLGSLWCVSDHREICDLSWGDRLERDVPKLGEADPGNERAHRHVAERTQHVFICREESLRSESCLLRCEGLSCGGRNRR